MNTTGKAFAGVAFAAAGVVAVQASAQPRLQQAGDGHGVAYGGAAAAERGNVAGGRAARLVGGGDDAALTYAEPAPTGPPVSGAVGAAGGRRG